jgi:hypothetical protein
MAVSAERKLLRRIARVMGIKTLDATSAALRELLQKYHDEADAGKWPTNDQYRKAADDVAREGECEIDDDAMVSRSDDPGAYVQAWVWVPNSDILQPDANDPSMLDVRDALAEHYAEREEKKILAQRKKLSSPVPSQIDRDDLYEEAENRVRAMSRNDVLVCAKRYKLIDQDEFDALVKPEPVAA